MTYRIFKYPINILDAASPGYQTLRLPKGAIFRAVQLQAGDVPTVWFEANDENPIEDRFLTVVGTGHEVPCDSHYLGTYQVTWGTYQVTWPKTGLVFVGHVYEILHQNGRLE